MGKVRGSKLSHDKFIMLKGTRGMLDGKDGSSESNIDNIGKSPGGTVNYYSNQSQIKHPDSSDRTVTIPFVSSHMNTDSIFYDVTLGFIFAAIFTFTVALLGIFLNWCCVCVFCPKLHRKRMRRRRIRERRKWILREQLFSPGIQLVPLTTVYNEVLTADDEEPKEEDEDRDQLTRMEYGQVDGEVYDDDDDYILSSGKNSQEKGRYEEGEIDDAAKQYFGDEDDSKIGSKNGSNKRSIGDDESVSSDSSNEACEPLLDLAAMELDLAMMEKKISDSMEKDIFI